MVISGLLIGASTYYEGITESFKSLHNGTISKIISRKFNALKEAYLKQKQEEAEKEDTDFSPTFIHLKNANYLHADSQSASTINNTWWRGRISSLDGFSFDFLVLKFPQIQLMNIS